MYEDVSIINLSHALNLKIAELGEDKASLYLDAQKKLLTWFDNGQKGELPEEVRTLPDVAWEEILRPLPAQAEIEQPDDFFFSPVDLSPVLTVLERIEERLQAIGSPLPSQTEPPKVPAAVDLSPVLAALEQMESRLADQLSRPGPDTRLAGTHPPSADLKPVLAALQEAENRLEERISQLEGDIKSSPPSAPVDLNRVQAALQRIEAKQSEFTGYAAPEPAQPLRSAPLPVLAGLLVVGLVLAFLIFWRTGALLSEQTRAVTTGQAAVGALQEDMQTVLGDIAEMAGNPGLGLTRSAERVAAEATASVLQGVIESRLVAAQTAEANLAALQAQAGDFSAVEALATTVAAQSTALANAATAIQTTETAQSQRQSALNIQSTAAASQMEQAHATAAALVQNAGTTATALYATAGTPNNQTAPPVTVTVTTATIPAGTQPEDRSVATPTPTPPQAGASQFEITFPPEGAELYVAPWQVEVTGSPWLAQGTRYKLLLSLVPLQTGYSADGDVTKAVIVYERSFANAGLLDDFPGMDNIDRQILDWDVKGGLAPGEYLLQFHLDDKSSATDWPLATRTFRIRDDQPPLAVLNLSANLRRLTSPSQSAPTDTASGLVAGSNAPVRILGRTTGFYQESAIEWVLWEADAPLRRGWAPVSFFNFLDGKTVADVPVIAPPQSK